MTEGDTYRKVRMSPELMEEWATRDVDGNRISWEWGEPDAEGFYTPTATCHYDDNLIRDCAAYAFVRDTRARLAREGKA